MKITVAHPTGNQFVRALIAEMIQAEMLAEFNTMLAIKPTASWLKLFPVSARHEWMRRTFSVPDQLLWTYPFREIIRMTLSKLGMDWHVRHEHSLISVDVLYKTFDRAVANRLTKQVSKRRIGGVYAYEDSALSSFTQAKALGIKCIYDLPIAYWEKGRMLMQEEAQRLPAWSDTLKGGIHDSPEKLERKVRELELADVVIGPSQFVIDSLPAWAQSKQVVAIPFGSPNVSALPWVENTKPTTGRPLRVLFVGSMSQRKGLGDLFAAVRLLNRPDLELVVMGSPMAPIDFYRNQVPNFRFEIGRPHEQVLALMRTCDVFCLPSIVEGRALVMQEAMSQGLPLIITPNTGGTDLIQEGQTGFLVPIRSPEAIAEKIAWFLDNRSAIPEMGRASRLHAARYTWESYGNQIVEFLSGSLQM